MSFSFDKHEPGCRPLAPCKSCEIIAFLKARLSAADLQQLDALMGGKPDVAPFDTPIRALRLSSRAANALHNDNFTTIRDVLLKTEGELFRIPNFGRRSMNELKAALKVLGHELGETVPPPEDS